MHILTIWFLFAPPITKGPPMPDAAQTAPHLRAASLLTHLCTPEERLTVLPPIGVGNRIGEWDLYTALCTHPATGRHRRLMFYAPRSIASAADAVFEGRGLQKAQLRRLITASDQHIRKAADVVVFADPTLTGPVLDGGGPIPAAAPTVVDDVLVFTVHPGLTVRVELTGDGPIICQR